jgi:hypothetical protein
VAAATALALVGAPVTLGGASAAFSATTANPGDALAADRLQPPSGLAVAQSCTVSPAVTHGGPTGVGGTTSVSVPVPSGTNAGDVLLAQVAYRDGPETITAPDGWTRLVQTSSGTQVTSAVYWKPYTGETSAVFSRPAGSPGDMAGVLVAYTGARRVAPTVYDGAAGTGTMATTPSLTTTATTVEVVHFLTKSQEYLPVPAGTTAVYQGRTSATSATVGLTAADETFAGSGTTASRSATSTDGNAQEWTAQTVVLRRTAGTPSAALTWTPSTSSWASGYELTRLVGSSPQTTQQVPGATSTGTTDGPLTNGTGYTYRSTAYRGTWRSVPVEVPFTPDC